MLQGYYGFCPSTASCTTDYYPGDNGDVDIGIFNRDGLKQAAAVGEGDGVVFGDEAEDAEPNK